MSKRTPTLRTVRRDVRVVHDVHLPAFLERIESEGLACIAAEIHGRDWERTSYRIEVQSIQRKAKRQAEGKPMILTEVGDVSPMILRSVARHGEGGTPPAKGVSCVFESPLISRHGPTFP